MKRFMIWMMALVMLCVHLPAMAQETDTISTATASETAVEIADSADYVEDVLSRDAITFRTVPDSIVANLKRDEDFAYANDPEFWKKERERITGKFTQEIKPGWFDILVSRPWFRTLLLIAMVCLLLFALIKIAVSNRLMLRRNPKQFGTVEDQEALQKDNLDNLVLQAEQQADFRLAVRYRYMRALQQMEARNIIQLDAKSTNWDYVNRLSNHPLKKQFLLLTRAYEYVWYGEFALNGAQYQYLKTEFEHYNNSLA